MAEEKKEQANPAENKPAEAAGAAPAGEAAAGEKRNKKINEMTLKELDDKLKEVKEKMGCLKSSYAMELLRQKDILSAQKK